MSESKETDPTGGSNQVATVQNGSEPPAATQDQNGQAPPAQREPTRMEGVISAIKSLVIRALIIYFISSFFKGPKPPSLQTSTTQTGPSVPAKNVFQFGTPLTLYVYLSESDTLADYNYTNLFWVKEHITYGDWTGGHNGDGTFEIEKEVAVTEGMKNNGSLFLHVFVTKLGNSPDPKSKRYNADEMTSLTKQLNRYKKLKSSKTKNLLTGQTGETVAEEGKIVSHWHPNFTINLLTDQTAWTFGEVPAPLSQHVTFTDDLKQYRPILYGNDYWNMARDYKPLDAAASSLQLRLLYQPLSLLKWQLYAAQSMKSGMFGAWGGDGDAHQHTDEEQDTIKETLMDTNPYLLGVTVAVSILHSVFELLAFKNDIQFWNNRNSLEGLSVRSVFFGVFQSLVVLLYVLDNETNTLIKVSCFAGLGIELWKIWKVVDVRVEGGRLAFRDKGSYVESSTKVYDELAFKYLSWLCFPLLAGYCGYALLYLEHKGWYSFVLDILYGYLLTFGFIMMTPQLFINYKLKSVAHLPWRMLTYKFLNTFIDDMFAFVIKMPTMYRIGCFRDDVVFLVFLYQRWIYPVDKTRRNEFGYVAEQREGAVVVAAEDAKKDQ